MARAAVVAGLLLAARSAEGGRDKVIDLGATAPQVPTAAPAGPRPSTSLTDLWQKRARALQEGRLGEANAAWNDLLTSMGFLGISRAEPFAVIELVQGTKRLAAGDPEGAEECLERALKLDPQLWSVHHVRSVAALRSSPAGLPAAVMHAGRAWALRLRGEESRYYLLLDAGLVLAVGFAVVAFVVALGSLLRHGTLLRHDVAEFFSGSFSPEVTRVLGWIILLLPLFAWLGPFWATIYWLAGLVAYMGVRERIAAFAALAMAVASPVLQEVVLHRAVPLISPPGPALLSAGWGLSSVGARVSELWESLGESDDVEGQRFLAYALRDAGRMDEAKGILEKIWEAHPRDATTLLDLGNLAFITGNDAMAIHYYTKATTADPNFALGLYNLGLAYNKQMRLADAEVVKRKAELLDPGLVGRVATRGGLAMMDARPSFPQILAMVKRHLPDDAPRRLRAKSPSATLFDPFVLAAAAALVAGVAMVVIRGRTHAVRCERCGQAYCARCKTEKERAGYCAACLHIFVKKEGITPEGRERKEAGIRRWRATRSVTRWVSAVVPGLSLHLAGAPLVGLALTLVAGIAIGAIVAGRTLVEPLQAFGQQASGGVGLPATILVLCGALGVALTMRMGDGEGWE